MCEKMRSRQRMQWQKNNNPARSYMQINLNRTPLHIYVPQARNTYNDDRKSLIRGFWSYWSTKWVFPNLIKRRKQPAIPLSLIPENGHQMQPNSYDSSTFQKILKRLFMVLF